MILYVRRKGMSTEILKEILAYIDEHIYEKSVCWNWQKWLVIVHSISVNYFQKLWVCQ